MALSYRLDAAGSSFFSHSCPLTYTLGYVNSSVFDVCASFLSATLTFEVGQISGYPLLFDEKKKTIVDSLVKEAVHISKDDDNSFETSWDFKRHPLV